MFLFPFLTAEHFFHVIIETTIVCICCISVFVFVPFWLMCGNTFMTKLHGIGVILCELRLLAVLFFLLVCALTSSQTCYLTQEFLLLFKKIVSIFH